MKKTLSLILALILVCGVALPAFAAESTHDVESLVYCIDEQTAESYREGFARLPVEKAKSNIMNAIAAIPRIGSLSAVFRGISDLFSALVQIPSRRAAFTFSELRYNTGTNSIVYREEAASNGTLSNTIPVLISSEKPVAKEADAEALLEMYNNAVKKTNDNGGLKGIYAVNIIDGSLKSENENLTELMNIYVSAGSLNSSGEESEIPGKGAVEIDDIKDIYAASVDGKTIIRILLNDQASDGYGISDNYSVRHGVGDMGNYIKSLSDSGIKIVSGKETIEINYTDAYITCIIDDATGQITGGTWHKITSLNHGDAEAEIFSATLDMNYSFAMNQDIVF